MTTTRPVIRPQVVATGSLVRPGGAAVAVAVAATDRISYVSGGGAGSREEVIFEKNIKKRNKKIYV